MFGEKELRDLQRRFESGEKNAVLLSSYAGYVGDITLQVLKSISTKTGHKFDEDKKEVLVQEMCLAVSHEIFNRKKHINSFRNFVWTAVVRLIYAKKEIARDAVSFVSLNEAMSVPDDRGIKVEAPDPLEFILQMSDGEELLKMVALSRSIRQLLVDLEQIKGLDWVCAHIKPLNSLYKRTRVRRYRV